MVFHILFAASGQKKKKQKKATQFGMLMTEEIEPNMILDVLSHMQRQLIQLYCLLYLLSHQRTEDANGFCLFSNLRNQNKYMKEMASLFCLSVLRDYN